MGAAFASNLIADGYQLTVFDRDERNAAPLVAAGAAAAAGLGDPANCEAVLTSLPDDTALEEVTLSPGGLVHVLAHGAIQISMSTISPGLSRRLAQQHSLAGQGYVAASVLATPILPAQESFLSLPQAPRRPWHGRRPFSSGLASVSLR
jgi:3-hydroxyisobutyrate dehydrogenase-like beta-hydroxyacid dehydrogenase